MPDMDPEQEQDALVQAQLVRTAYRFLHHFYDEDDLAAAWAYVDPVLRLCWAQW